MEQKYYNFEVKKWNRNLNVTRVLMFTEHDICLGVFRPNV